VKSRHSELAPNWADLLTLTETEDILNHWKLQVIYWSEQAHPQGLFEEPVLPSAQRHLGIVRSRVAMWTEVLAAKRLGESVQHILYRYRRDA